MYILRRLNLSPPLFSRRLFSHRLLSFHLLVLSLAALLLTGCFGWGQSAPEPVPVQLRMASFPGNSPWTRAEEAVIAGFGELEPHIEIERSGFQDTIERTVSAASPPDLMLTATIYPLYQAMAQDQLQDVTELWESAGLAQTFPAPFHAISRHDGKQFFVPIGYPWSAIYYNRALFESLNLQPPQTWDEFLILCEQLRSQGIAPLSLASGDPSVAMMWFEYLNMRLNGPAFHRSLLQGEVSFEDSRVIAALESWRTLFANDYFLRQQIGNSNLDSLMALIPTDAERRGDPAAAMALIHSGILVDLPGPFQAELDFFRFPILDPSVPVGEAAVVYGYMIPRAAEETEAALTFLNYLATPPAQALIAEHLNSGTVVYAPTNLPASQVSAAHVLEQGIAIVAAAEELTPFFLLNLPDSMANAVAQALARWLRQPGDVLEFARALESARQEAQAQNLFAPLR